LSFNVIIIECYQIEKLFQSMLFSYEMKPTSTKRSWTTSS